VSLNARYYPDFGVSWLHPFAALGPGLYILDPGGTKLGFNAGVGAQFDIIPELAIETAVNYHRMERTAVEPNFVTVQAGIRYRFLK